MGKESKRGNQVKMRRKDYERIGKELMTSEQWLIIKLDQDQISLIEKDSGGRSLIYHLLKNNPALFEQIKEAIEGADEEE